ncbi:SDR family oxidoreductase [Microbacterium aurantiacum]|uniref:SDR family oxidoreductase n=1 Tax=Microbacterium aurantiacum TaxID=162393 RepID=UPI00341C8C42
MDDLSTPTGREAALVAVPAEDGTPPRVLVLGATGYIGGRLVPRLLAAGYRVRVLARDTSRLGAFTWGADVESVQGDATDAEAMAAATADVDVLYYLVHSMSAGAAFEDADRRAARTVADAAAGAGVSRIVYLGGLHPEDAPLSAHLRSRVEVGEVFLASGVPTLVLQAGVDIGGPDVLRYGQMMNGYAVVAGLPQRAIAALPVLTPRLASHWVNLVTPIPRSIARPLVESLQNECVMKDHDIDDLIPPPEDGLTSYRHAVRLALGREQEDRVETSWLDAEVLGVPSDPLPSDPDWAGRTVFVDARSAHTSAPQEALWRVIEGIGGANGWYSSPILWAIRGWMDRLVGGIGLARGRRSRERLQVGDALDFWRVEALESGSFLRLRAEMKVPGLAWLELRAVAEENGSRYEQRAVFFPLGLAGRLYWLAVLPFHGFIFSGMASRIAATAEMDVEASAQPVTVTR